MQRQSRRQEEQILAQSLNDHLAQLARGWRILRQLHVIFGSGRLMARGYAAIDPLRFIENLAPLGNLFRCENVWNTE